MLPDLATILIHIFCLADDFCKSNCQKGNHQGAPYKVCDSELMTMVLIQALLGIESERSFLRFLDRFLPGYFPVFDQSQYNRRLKLILPKLDLFRKNVLSKLNIQTDMFVIDSMPIPVINPVRVNYSGSFPELSFGHTATLKQDYYGGKLHLLVTASGIPVRFEFTTATVDDRDMLEELLFDCGFITTVGDKGYLDEDKRREFAEQNITLIVPHRKNQKKQLPEIAMTLYKKTRKRIESVLNQFTDHMSIKRCLAKTLQGLTARILQKITAFTTGIYLNKLFGRKRLAIKSLLA